MEDFTENRTLLETARKLIKAENEEIIKSENDSSLKVEIFEDHDMLKEKAPDDVVLENSERQNLPTMSSSVSSDKM